MEELEVKKDFTDIYTQETPYAYLNEMKRLQYRIADHTKPLYLSLADQLYEKLQRPVNIIDVGSSYGINAALMKHNLTTSQLDEFFLKDDEPTKSQTKKFFDSKPTNEKFNFYQIDISKPALQFSEDVGLCKKGLHVNLETCGLDLLDDLPDFDMMIATGCIGYIGFRAFANLFEALKKRESEQQDMSFLSPIFAFSVLRMFDMKKIQKTFDYYGYSVLNSNLKPMRQRQFSDMDEKQQTISLLHGKGIDTKWYEEDGHFYANFYLACQKKLVPQLAFMSTNMKKKIAS